MELWKGLGSLDLLQSIPSYYYYYYVRKLVSLGYIVWCCYTLSHFSRTPTCDRQTQTDGHRPTASTAEARGVYAI